MPAADSPAELGPDVLREAARWLVLVHSGEAAPADYEALERWRRDRPDHERAWQRAQRLSAKFGAVPPALGVPVLTRQVRLNRRAVLKTVALLGVTAPAAWFGYRAYQDDAGDAYRAATGETRQVLLADRSRVQLNTATAISVDYSQAARLVRLRQGEIYIETARDGQGQRPFLVQTGQGLLRALGTRFSVRALSGDGERTALAVLEHRVEVTLAASGQRRTFGAGETIVFSAQAFEVPAPASASGAPAPSLAAPGWTRGLLQADDMRLDAFLAELSRYRPGIIRCAPEVAGLRVSGVFRLDDTDHVLDVISRTLPVHVARRTSYWVTVTQAAA